MLSAKQRNTDVIPVGDLGIIALSSSTEMGKKIDAHIVSWRKERDHIHSDASLMQGYDADTFLIRSSNPRFGSGEAKGLILDSVRGLDLYILVDVCNYSVTYSMNGITNRMSPDDYFQDLKRIISAVGGKARRITVVMPYLYEGRQMTRHGRESLDCAVALQELIAMGVSSIITFDAHDPRIQNSIPLYGFENYQVAYQLMKAIYKAVPDFKADPEHLMVVSPDEGGTKRAIYMASVIGNVDMGMFYKRRDYTHSINGVNPIIAHEFLGSSIEGKDVIIVDDMISSGSIALETAAQLKQRNAKRIFICSTFGLFTNGMARFDKAHEEGIFDALFTTNLTYEHPEAIRRPYYHSCDMSKFLALIIDTMNHDGSVSSLLDPIDRIHHFLDRKRSEEKMNAK